MFTVGYRSEPPADELIEGVELLRAADDLQTAIIEACAVLAEVEGASFELRGFGRDPWPLDVAYDMSSFLEQVGELSRALRKQQPTAVDLYSQGIEATLEFEPHGDLVTVRCRSRTDWTPDPADEVVSRSTLERTLADFVAQVANGLAEIEPTLLDRSPFSHWAKGLP